MMMMTTMTIDVKKTLIWKFKKKIYLKINKNMKKHTKTFSVGNVVTY